MELYEKTIFVIVLSIGVLVTWSQCSRINEGKLYESFERIEQNIEQLKIGQSAIDDRIARIKDYQQRTEINIDKSIDIIGELEKYAAIIPE